jgi:hypothetical protein
LISEHNPTGRSRRGEENLTGFRHLLIESDSVDCSLWLAALVQIPLPILPYSTRTERGAIGVVVNDPACLGACVQKGILRDHFREMQLQLWDEIILAESPTGVVMTVVTLRGSQPLAFKLVS